MKTESSDPNVEDSQVGRLRFLFRDSMIYGTGAAIAKGAALVSFPIIARHLTVEQYGALDFYLVCVNVLTILLVFGQDSAVARYFYEYENRKTRQRLISQSLISQLFGLALLLPILWLGKNLFFSGSTQSEEMEKLSEMLIFHLPCMLLINFSQNILRWTFSRRKFLLMTAGYATFQAGMLALAVVFWSVSLVDIVLIHILTSVFFSVVGIAFIRDWLVSPRDTSLIREMLPFAAPYGVMCLMGAALPALERALTAELLGPESLGLYAVSTKLAMIIGLLASAFQAAWGPFSLSIYKQQDAGQTFNLVLVAFTTCICLSTLLLTLCSQPLIVVLASEKYMGALLLIFPVAMSLSVQAVSWITEIGISISKRSYLGLYAYTSAILVSAVAVIALAPWLGLVGIGAGVLVGQVVRAVVASWLAQRAYPLPWRYVPIILVIVATVTGGLSSAWFTLNVSTAAANYVLVATMVFIAGLSWTICLTSGDRSRIQAFFARRRMSET